MAMIACGECTTQISETAKSCPKCGWVPPALRPGGNLKNVGRKLHTYGWALLLLAFIIAGAAGVAGIDIQWVGPAMLIGALALIVVGGIAWLIGKTQRR